MMMISWHCLGAAPSSSPPPSFPGAIAEEFNDDSCSLSDKDGGGRERDRASL